MEKKILLLLGLAVLSFLVISCAPQSEKVELQDEQGNVVGEAFKVSPNVYKFVPPKQLESLQKPKYVGGQLADGSCGSGYYCCEYYCEDDDKGNPQCKCASCCKNENAPVTRVDYLRYDQLTQDELKRIGAIRILTGVVQ